MIRSRWMLILLLSIGCQLFAQDSKQLSELWLSYEVKHKLNKKWKFYGNGQMRLANANNSRGELLLEAAAKRKVSKLISVKLQYRYNFIDGFRNTQRAAIDGQFKWQSPSRKVSFVYRTRLQVKRVNYNGQIISVWRNKVGGAYAFSDKFSTYLHYENFIELVKLKSFLRADPPAFSKNRFTLGGKFEIEKQAFKAFYRLESFPDQPNVLVHIWGISISQDL